MPLHTLLELLKSKRLTTPSFGKYVEELGLSYTNGGNVKLSNHGPTTLENSLRRCYNQFKGESKAPHIGIDKRC